MGKSAVNFRFGYFGGPRETMLYVMLPYGVPTLGNAQSELSNKC